MRRTVGRGVMAPGFGSVATLLVLGVLAPALEAQSASDIVDRMLGEYARRAESVNDYTLVQEVMGFETGSYVE